MDKTVFALGISPPVCTPTTAAALGTVGGGYGPLSLPLPFSFRARRKLDLGHLGVRLSECFICDLTVPIIGGKFTQFVRSNDHQTCLQPLRASLRHGELGALQSLLAPDSGWAQKGVLNSERASEIYGVLLPELTTKEKRVNRR